MKAHLSMTRSMQLLKILLPPHNHGSWHPVHTSPPHPQIFKENLLKLTLARSIHVQSNMIAHLSIKRILPSNFFTLRFANDSSKVFERFPIYTHQPLDPQLQASDE